LNIAFFDHCKTRKAMSAIVATDAEAVKEQPMHIDVKDLTFGYAGREVCIRRPKNNPQGIPHN
jgi:hypothetical protein